MKNQIRLKFIKQDTFSSLCKEPMNGNSLNMGSFILIPYFTT